MSTAQFNEERDAWFSRGDRFDGFDRGDLDNSFDDELAAKNEAEEQPAPTRFQLTVEFGRLALHGRMLLCIYEAGDCDSAPWPMTTIQHRRILARALFDERECGDLTGDTVILPDGTSFEFDGWVR
jgi:hypothetical protein